MIKINGEKIKLKEATESEIAELYDWKYEEKEQAAKQWNHTYITKKKMTKQEYRKAWDRDSEILPGIPAILIITVNEKLGRIGLMKIRTGWKQALLFMIKSSGTAVMEPEA